MEWLDIIAARGDRTPRAVTLAYRRAGARSQPGFVLGIPGIVNEAMGWKPKDRLRIQVSADGEKMRLSLGEDKARSVSLLGKAGARLLNAVFSIPDTDPGDNKPAEDMPHSLEAAAVIVTLPAWARPATQKPASAPQPVAAVVAPPAAPRPGSGPLRSPEPSLLTTERADLFRVLWQDGVTTKAEIARLVNQTSPHVPPFQGKSAMNDIANRLGLPVDRSVYRPVEQLPPLPPMPESEPAPRPTRMGQHSLPTVHPQRAEAVECFIAGMGPRAVEDELGCGLSTAANWFAEWKAEQKGKAA